MTDHNSLQKLLAELRELQRLHVQDKALIDDLRRQNNELRSMLQHCNAALQKCIRELEKALYKGGSDT
ncbi:hypothetical protein PHISCL_08663 [Aspergillus sclerotialis]|uniref:Uncharacterized protein n=1 Tax=Aspergillus sclerotialis TaxID=2070753 RepID=A0A3A2ZPH8_9EURO|nr:hypothetical protein PHISCL_08663 [Aspergillus sclerotialis]